MSETLGFTRFLLDLLRSPSLWLVLFFAYAGAYVQNAGMEDGKWLLVLAVSVAQSAFRWMSRYTFRAFKSLIPIGPQENRLFDDPD